MKSKQKLISLEEHLANRYPTKAAKENFKKEVVSFAAENRKEVLKELGAMLKSARLTSGITQADLAKKMATDKANISRIENGRQNLSMDYVFKMAKAMNRRVKVEIF